MPPNGTHTNGTPAVKSVGYIGLGNAGYSMASNLPKAGYKLIVHDADTAKAEKAAAEWKNTTASHGRPEAFAECEVIITMLPQGKIVREVLLGENGIARGLKAGMYARPICRLALSPTISSLCCNSTYNPADEMMQAQS